MLTYLHTYCLDVLRCLLDNQLAFYYSDKVHQSASNKCIIIIIIITNIFNMA